MKFRANFGAKLGPLISMGAIFTCMWFRDRHWIWALIWFVTAALALLIHIFTYLELNSDYLRQRKLWKVQEVPLKDVVSVDCYSLGFASNDVKLTYAASSKAKNPGCIIATPALRGEFFDALRRLAPQATFDL
jgi:hypothetical protein